MSEVSDVVRKSEKRVRLEESGQSFDDKQYALASYGPEWEYKCLSFPSLIPDPTPLQNEDGDFVFMLGLDGLGEAPLG